MRYLFLMIAMLLSSETIGQDSLKYFKLSASDALEDYNLYTRILKETHPGLYRYTEETKMNNRIDSLSSTIKDSLYLYDFYKKIAWLNSSIKCSHSYVIPTKDFNSYMLKNPKSVPFYLIPVNGKFYVLFNGSTDTSIKPGFEVIAINDTPVTEIADVFKKHFWTDGNVDLGNNNVLQGRLFRTYYYMLVDQSEVLKFKFLDLEGTPVEKELQAVTTLDALKNYKKNPVNKEVFKLYQSKERKWQVLFPKDIPNTATLVIPGFAGKKVHSEEEAIRKMSVFMEEALQKIQKRKVNNLIIELRDNSGGWDIMGTTLISYLMQKQDSIAYYGPSFTITNDTEFLKDSDLSEYDLANIEKELEPQPDGTFKLKSAYNLSHGWIKKKANAFNGQVYILMNEYTASAASEFCAIVKSNQIGILVGQETNGTYGGLNGSTFINRALPNSKILIQTPLVKNYLAVKNIQPLDRGVLPDYSIAFTIDDVLKRKDIQLELVKELIRKNSTN